MPRSHQMTTDVVPIEQSLAEACALFGATDIKPRNGASWPAQVLATAGTIVVLLAVLSLIDDVKGWAIHRVEVLFIVGGLGMWRWGWCLFQCARAAIYRYWVFPRIRRQAARIEESLGPVSEVAILATTYHEKPWITLVVFESVFRELSTLEGLARPPRVVVVGGCDEDDATVRRIYESSCARLAPMSPSAWPPELVLLRGDNGKRLALDAGLREIARGGMGPDGVVVLMDGDTIMGPEMLRKVLPIFRLPDPVGAVTTNENGLVHGPGWFAEWISMRLGQRHRTMCSVALSGKVLCLTGRLSAFRSSIATNPSFISQIEHDSIDHWLWGKVDMLSGDDKSSWYWLAANRHRMLYIPDAMATTVEVVTGSALVRVHANLKRWSGNTLRNSDRVIALGPGTMGLIPWWSTVDQRICNWTALVGPVLSILGVLAGRYEVAIGYVLWAMVSRSLISVMYWRHGRRVSAFYMPLELLSSWLNAVIKIWVSSHPAKQSWLNRGNRSLDSTKGSASRRMRGVFADYLFYFSMAAFIIGLGCFGELLPFIRESPLFLGVNLRVSGQVAIDPAQLFHYVTRNTAILPMARELPLHSAGAGTLSMPVGVGPSSFANLLGYEPVVLQRGVSAATGFSPPRSFKRRLYEPEMPRYGIGGSSISGPAHDDD